MAVESIGSKRSGSTSPLNNDEENETMNSSELKRPRKVADRLPLSNQVNYMTVSAPDDGDRTRVVIRSADHFQTAQRVGEENFLVWTCSKSWRDLKQSANVLVEKSENAQLQNQSATQSMITSRTASNPELWLRKYAPSSYMDLVSDEATNRIVLQWFRLWDKGVFGKVKKSRLSASRSNDYNKDVNQQFSSNASNYNKNNNQQFKNNNNYNKNYNKNNNQQFNNNNNYNKNFNKNYNQQFNNNYNKNNNNQQFNNNNFKWQNRNQIPVPELDSTETWPAQRICLLTGPPGLGKTTLAHIAARHCGYDMVEVNASDDRSASVFGDYIESVVETRAVFQTDNSKPKPACLIFDEIDGAPQAAIDVLISYVTQSHAELKSDSKKSKKAKSKRRELRRPVICICNDQFATSLRNLRRHCFIVTCLVPPTERLAFRVNEICRKENLEIDSSSVNQIVDRARGDIRVCINVLQTLKAACFNIQQGDLAVTQRRSRNICRISNEQVAKLPGMGFNKDVELSIFDCLQTIFKQPPVTSKTTKFDLIQKCVHMNSDHELLVGGIFENYLNARIRDDFLQAAGEMSDWFSNADLLQSSAMSIAGAEIGFAMTYTTTPLVATACNLMFATAHPGRMIFPKTAIEMRQLHMQRKSLLGTFFAGMSPSERVFFNSTQAVIFDLLPSLVDVIQPTMRPVSNQLFSMAEKADISRVVHVMASLGLTFVQRLSIGANERKNWQSSGSQLGFYLEPPVDTFVVFDRKPSEEFNRRFGNQDDNKLAQSANIWRLSQSVRQYLGSEITLFLARKAAVRAMGGLIDSVDGTKAPSGLSTAVLMERDRAQADMMKELEGGLMNAGEEKVQTAISSYFSRPANSKKSAKNALSVLKSPPGRSRDKVWFHFNEGYSNAVRRPARVKQFF